MRCGRAVALFEGRGLVFANCKCEEIDIHYAVTNDIARTCLASASLSLFNTAMYHCAPALGLAKVTALLTDVTCRLLFIDISKWAEHCSHVVQAVVQPKKSMIPVHRHTLVTQDSRKEFKAPTSPQRTCQ